MGPLTPVKNELPTRMIFPPPLKLDPPMPLTSRVAPSGELSELTVMVPMFPASTGRLGGPPVTKTMLLPRMLTWPLNPGLTKLGLLSKVTPPTETLVYVPPKMRAPETWPPETLARFNLTDPVAALVPPIQPKLP